MLAAILHLGRVSIVKNEDPGANMVSFRDAGGVSMIKVDMALQRAMEWLGLYDKVSDKAVTHSEKDLGFWLTHKEIVGSQQPLSVNKARGIKATLMAYLYSTLFDWLLEQINKYGASEGDEKKDHSCFNVLDIFGFESFKRNSLEQLCKNLANDRLQVNFMQTVIDSELNILKEEGVDIGEIQLSGGNGERMLKLIDCKDAQSPGIFQIIEETMKMGAKATESALFESIKKQHKGSDLIQFLQSLMLPDPDKDGKVDKETLGFKIKHYAGDVDYTIENLLDKSSVEFPASLSKLLANSQSPLITELIAFDKARGKSKAKSVGSAFKLSLNSLAKTIEESGVHYVRCIKPNDLKVAAGEEGCWDEVRAALMLANLASFSSRKLTCTDLATGQGEGPAIGSWYLSGHRDSQEGLLSAAS